MPISESRAHDSDLATLRQGWRRWACARRLDPEPRAVLLYLVETAKADGLSLRSAQRIARDLALSIQVTRMALATLIRRGCITAAPNPRRTNPILDRERARYEGHCFRLAALPLPATNGEGRS